MGRIKQSVSWWCFADGRLTPEQLVRTSAKIGYAAIELAGEEYWPLIKEHGLEIAAIVGHTSIPEGLNRRAHHGQIEREILANLEKARTWGIANLIVFSGNRNGQGDAEGAEIVAEGLQRVAGAAEDAGVTLVLELLNSKVDHPDYQADRTDWGVTVCSMVNSVRVKLLYDIYHMQVMEGDVISSLRTNMFHIGHVHTAGVPGRHELDEHQELYYPAIMRAIAATDYVGYVGQEFIPKGEPIAALEQAFRVCDI